MHRTAARAVARPLAFALCLLLSACAPRHPKDPAADPTAGRFEVEIGIEGGGALVLEFDRQAAPQAVAALESSFRDGRWQGVEIGWIRPHTEIRTAPPTGMGEIVSELDAHALHLDAQRIADVGEAMGVIHTELEPALQRADAVASPQLHAWVRTWRAHFDAAFLVGTSRMQINEALGYRYAQGYASQPLRRGSVALVAAGTPGRSTFALALLLRDQPERDGRWVVVGAVHSGLELIERLSLAPRTNPKRQEPATPARIASTSIRNPGNQP